MPADANAATSHKTQRYEHGAHTEVDPAGGIEIAHACIDEREACLTFAPGVEVGFVKVVFAQTITASGHILQFDRRFALELLNEMAVPM